jgi:COP9 signalosome complex subunit 5
MVMHTQGAAVTQLALTEVMGLM